MKNRVHLFVEGGGNSNKALKIECRKAFAKLIEAAGFDGRMPRIVACGGRGGAFDAFQTELQTSSTAVLLVDSEGPVFSESVWQHVKNRDGDGWEKPASANEDDLHFMVQFMETWLIADVDAIKLVFGNSFKEKKIPKNQNLESVSKNKIMDGLEKATQDCSSQYNKGVHSFKILASVNPEKLTKECPYAKRFFAHLNSILPAVK